MQVREEAAAGSLVGRLRAVAAEKRAAEELVIDLPGRWQGLLRARYGAVSLDTIELYSKLPDANSMGASLDLLSRACKAIEAHDEETGEWETLEDEQGPVTFDDRLTRLLGWPRPADEFRFSARQVYEGMIGRAEGEEVNGFAVGQHVREVSEWMGVTEREIGVGESTGGGPRRSAPPPSSG